MWVLMAIGGVIFFNYIRQQGQTIQNYLPQIGIIGLILFLIGSKKAEVESFISEREAVRLAKGLIEDKRKSGILPAGTKYYGGLICPDKTHDGQPKHYVVSGKLVMPDSEIIHIGIKVNYNRPGNPRIFKSVGELKGDEQVPTVYLPGWLGKQRERFPWMFRGGGST